MKPDKSYFKCRIMPLASVVLFQINVLTQIEPDQDKAYSPVGNSYICRVKNREVGSRTQYDWQFSFPGICSDAFETQVIFFCIITHNSLSMGLICTAHT